MNQVLIVNQVCAWLGLESIILLCPLYALLTELIDVFTFQVWNLNSSSIFTATRLDSIVYKTYDIFHKSGPSMSSSALDDIQPNACSDILTEFSRLNNHRPNTLAQHTLCGWVWTSWLVSSDSKWFWLFSP